MKIEVFTFETGHDGCRVPTVTEQAWKSMKNNLIKESNGKWAKQNLYSHGN